MLGVALNPGEPFGRFRIDSKLGAGGMGEVYRATDLRLGRALAIKILPPDFADDPARRARFEKESRAAAAFNHPNIVTVYDAGVEGNLPWIAMELVEGSTLSTLIAGATLSVPQIIDIAVPIAGALAHAHQSGIFHRDLKPANIMITPAGVPKILDFGLAHIAPVRSDETESLTAVGTVAGTLGYMAPEQLRGLPSDHRADQFALGTVLFEMAKGANPFLRDSNPQTIAAILESSPTLDIAPARFSSIVNRCLEKDPKQRYSITADLAAELKSLQKPAVKPARSLRRPVVAVTAALILVASAAGLWKWRTHARPSKTATIAVRSFKNLSANPALVYYSGSISDEVRARLSLLSASRTLPRGIVDRVPDANLHKAAAGLGADYVLEGSVEATRPRLRVKVQLTSTATTQPAWTQQYDRSPAELPVLRGEIALHVANFLRIPITPNERARLESRPTAKPEAYDLYLQSLLTPANTRDSVFRSVGLLKQAVDLDPKYADAMANISYLLMLNGDPRFFAESHDWALKAVAADPESATAHQSLGAIHANKGAFSKSRASFRRAIELDPNDTRALNNLSVFECQMANYEEGLRLAVRALELNPRSSNSYFHVSLPLQYLGTAAQYSEWLRMWKERFPSSHRALISPVINEVFTGDYTRVLESARKLAQTFKGNMEVASLVVDIAMVAGAPDAEQLLLDFTAGGLDGNFGQYTLFPESPRTRLAWFQTRRGNKAAAAKLLDDAEKVAIEQWRAGVQAPGVPIELSAIHAMRGDANEAATWYQRAYELGWRERINHKVDPMIAPAAAHPRFQAVVKMIEDDLRRKSAESAQLKTLFDQIVPSLPPPPPAVPKK